MQPDVEESEPTTDQSATETLPKNPPAAHRGKHNPRKIATRYSSQYVVTELHSPRRPSNSEGGFVWITGNQPSTQRGESERGNNQIPRVRIRTQLKLRALPRPGSTDDVAGISPGIAVRANLAQKD